MPRNSGIASSLFWLGWILVGLGSASVLLGIFTSIFTWSFVKYIGCSIWAGLFVLVTGVIGVRSGKFPENNCLAIAFMVMNIISILAAFVQWIFSAVGITTEGYWDPTDYNFHFYEDWKPYYSQEASATLHSLTLIVGLAEMVVAFSASICCCCHLCNQSSQQGQRVIAYTTPGQPTVVSVLPSGQVMQYQYPQPTTIYSTTTTTNQPEAQGYVVPSQPIYPNQPPQGQTWQPGQQWQAGHPPYAGQQPTVQQYPPYANQPATQPAAPPLYEEIAEPSKEAPPPAFH